mmetsp:Transcript_57772/g.183139  ORF Transcript_57772/g.183139 Transcript_57772/m.183139 type:complete len:529 (-) Transcript_57772:902-2488(-)
MVRASSATRSLYGRAPAARVGSAGKVRSSIALGGATAKQGKASSATAGQARRGSRPSSAASVTSNFKGPSKGFPLKEHSLNSIGSSFPSSKKAGAKGMSDCPRCGFMPGARGAGGDGGLEKPRSDAINLEVVLSERLRQLEEVAPPGKDGRELEERRLAIYSDLFDAIIERVKGYSHLLGMVKREYDAASGRVGSRLEPGGRRGAHLPMLRRSLSREEEEVAAAVVAATAAARDLQDERARWDAKEREQGERAERLEAEAARAREECKRLRDEAAGASRELRGERERLEREKGALLEENRALESVLVERDQDMRHMGEIIKAVSRGDIQPSQLVCDEVTQREPAPGPEESPDAEYLESLQVPSLFKGVAPEDITWGENAMSAREPKRAPMGVPSLALGDLPPPRESDAAIADELFEQQQQGGGGEENEDEFSMHTRLGDEEAEAAVEADLAEMARVMGLPHSPAPGYDDDDEGDTDTSTDGEGSAVRVIGSWETPAASKGGATPPGMPPRPISALGFDSDRSPTHLGA